MNLAKGRSRHSGIATLFTLIRKFGGTLNGGTIYVCRAEGAPSGGGPTARRS